jgi:hypothetical protein
MRKTLLLFLWLSSFPFMSYGQDKVGATAMKAASEAESAKEKDEGGAAAAGSGQDYETVIKAGKYRESDLVGKYKQPVWTLKRRFATTRVFVLPKGEIALEYWLITRGELTDDTGPSFEQRLEVEFGLGKRFQVDFYLIFEQEKYDAPLEASEQSIELRYAFADWGKLPGNPTLYLEWIRQNEKPEAFECKLLLGGQLAPRWFYGINLVYEVELGDEYEQEFAASAGVSSVLIDRHLLLGFEGKIAAVDEKGSRFHFSKEAKLLLGPSLQVKSANRFHIDLVPMFGTVFEDREIKPIYEIYAIVGASF